MIHNIYNFKIGNTVTIDAGHANSSTVKILYISPGGMFSTVYHADGKESDKWNTMTNRLTPLKNNDETKFTDERN